SHLRAGAHSATPASAGKSRPAGAARWWHCTGPLRRDNTESVLRAPIHLQSRTRHSAANANCACGADACPRARSCTYVISGVSHVCVAESIPRDRDHRVDGGNALSAPPNRLSLGGGAPLQVV